MQKAPVPPDRQLLESPGCEKAKPVEDEPGQVLGGDLQIGGLWTDPEARRLGLARAAISEALRRHAVPGRCFWYLVDDDNAASIGLAEACGYRMVGVGRRTRPLGVRGLGRFLMDAATAPRAR